MPWSEISRRARHAAADPESLHHQAIAGEATTHAPVESRQRRRGTGYRFDWAAIAAKAVAGSTTPAMLSAPCAEWDVRALVEHVTGNHERMAWLLHGQAVDDRGGSDPAQRWSVAYAAVRSGLSIPGALDRMGRSPFGGQAAVADVARILTVDLITHTWDLARAVGADEVLDPDVVADLLPMVERFHPAMAASGKFAPPVSVPEFAEAQQRLLALLGRRAG
ncbi:TIGR03086 family metal-binding protein [Nocardia sp. NPDC047038]|uniref:TIGR03086 family metal-binding protein n=1 Tax=Nocardia sp. NPDC047038 TaxID=3154338 RepID=UPI003401FD9A